MAVKASGTQLSITTDIVGEFSGSTPHALSEYIRGGSLVPNGPTANANIPTTALPNSNIQFSDFYSAVNVYETVGYAQGLYIVSDDYTSGSTGPVVVTSSHFYVHSDGTNTYVSVQTEPTTYDESTFPTLTVIYTLNNAANYYCKMTASGVDYDLGGSATSGYIRFATGANIALGYNTVPNNSGTLGTAAYESAWVQAAAGNSSGSTAGSENKRVSTYAYANAPGDGGEWTNIDGRILFEFSATGSGAADWSIYWETITYAESDGDS
jgi:hypothetical protein